MAGLILVQKADFCSKEQYAAMTAGFEEPQLISWSAYTGRGGKVWPTQTRATSQLYAYGSGDAVADSHLISPLKTALMNQLLEPQSRRSTTWNRSTNAD